MYNDLESAKRATQGGAGTKSGVSIGFTKATRG